MQKLKKAQLSIMPEAALGLIVVVAIVALGVILLVGFNDTTDNTAAQGVIGKGVDTMTTFGDWLPTIGIAIVFVIVLGIILMLRNRAGGI